MIDDKKEFGKNLRKWRKARAITQEKLAEIADTTTQTISSYECGGAVPGFNTIVKLANALDVSLGQLFNYDKACLTIDDIELQYVLVEKFRDIPYDKRVLIYRLIDAVMAENNEV